ncbi:MAG: hypothetical protein CMJ40_09990 [Phycisphaerae bacterium]|nr:hypothetical protein [Phycisphaerae bacterium]
MSPEHSLEGDSQHLHPLQRSWKHIILRILGILVAVGLIALAYIYLLEPYMGSIEGFVKSLGSWGPLAFIGIFFICTFLFLPESIFSIAAGTLFGLWMGWVWVVLAGFITALGVFWFVRLCIRDRINRMIKRHPKAYAVEEAMGQSGFKILFLLRLAPVNYSLLNYMGAVSPCRFKPFMLACIGMIPGNFSGVYMGYVARHTSDLARHIHEHGRSLPQGDSMVREITIYGGLIVAIVASVVVARVALKAIHKETLHQKALKEQEDLSPALEA